MSFSIQNNYSTLNNYNYTNKPTSHAILDSLSTPCRRILGGRSVDLLSQTFDSEMPTVLKVITFILSIIIFPIAIISALSLALKLVTRSQDFEKNKIKEQSAQTWNTINVFKKSFNENDYDQAIAQIKKNPSIAKRSEISTDLFKIINKKINTHASWQEIQPLIPLLQNNDAIKLIEHAIRVRLTDEGKSSTFYTNPDAILNFIHASLNGRNTQEKDVCYESLLKNALHLNDKQSDVMRAIKMYVADSLISSMVNMAGATDELARTKARTKDLALRMEYAAHTFMYEIFSSYEKMLYLKHAVNEACNACQLNRDTLSEQKLLELKNASMDLNLSFELGVAEDKINNLILASASPHEKNVVNVFIKEQWNEIALVHELNNASPTSDFSKIFNTLNSHAQGDQNKCNDLLTILKNYESSLKDSSTEKRIHAALSIIKLQNTFLIIIKMNNCIREKIQSSIYNVVKLVPNENERNILKAMIDSFFKNDAAA